MKSKQVKKVNSITEYHQLTGLSKPKHPLISVINLGSINHPLNNEKTSFVFAFYVISLKRNFRGKMSYGQQMYDFDEGVMSFIAPGQVFSFDTDARRQLSGCLILFHPDFLWNTSLAKTIKKYDYFDYSVTESLFLSEKEEKLLLDITQIITQEYHANIDQYSQDIIIAQLESILIYAERFYQRQFITRKITNHKILDQFENLLTAYCNSEKLATEGIPTIDYISEALHISPNYLSRLLKTLTGQSTKKFVQDKLISLAKEKLSTTDLSINEIAYELGFEHPQSFSKLFKSKTNLSPLAFKQSFN